MSLFKREKFSTFFNMKKVIILAALSLLGQHAHAQIREFQTTRLMSTSGAGVASILSTEAAVLNPAASAFFEGSSFSYQSYRTALQNKSEIRDTAPDRFPTQNTTQGAFMADHSGPVKGGVAYIKQNENSYERERMVLHAAASMSSTTSVGLSYNYIADTLPPKTNDRHKVHHQATMGVTHILDDSTTLGLVLIDPTKATPGEERAIGGFQYSIAQRVTLIGDLGAQFTQNVSKKYLWRAAVQLNIFGDVFFRAGQFYDNITQLKGNGWGVSWIGPRIGLEFAQKYSKQFGTGTYVYTDEKIVDTSLSAIIKF
jgi:hypothetical protein